MGHLTLLIGCMFAQKTTELLRRIRRYQSIGYSVLVVNYIGDTRYGVNRVASHDNQSADATCIETLESIDSIVYSGKYRVIAIDEGQFFKDLYKYITKWADELPDIAIVVAGLDGDSDRKPFGDMLSLIPHAEEVERLSAFCSQCRDSTIAIYSLWISDTYKDPSGIVISGKESYQPVCRKHYLLHYNL